MTTLIGIATAALLVLFAFQLARRRSCRSRRCASDVDAASVAWMATSAIGFSGGSHHAGGASGGGDGGSSGADGGGGG